MMLEREDKVISDFLNSLGLWHKFIIIGGGYALFIYKLYFADKKLENPPIGTRDIDSLIPRKVPEISKKNIAEHLHEAGFKQVFKDMYVPATEIYVKEIDGLEIEIEFLTDSAARNNKTKNITLSGVVAQPLSYLTLSLQNTLEFHTYSNEIGTVVSPEAWIFHKGLTFTKRNNHSKLLKDLYGIWYVATQLGDFSELAIEKFNILAKEYSRWFETFQKNLHNWIENASPVQWTKLELQDPSGRLKKLNFEMAMRKLSGSQKEAKLNEVTEKSLKQSLAGKKIKKFDTLNHLFKDIGI